MSLTRLSLTDFRSYADALVAPGPGFVILTGENGAGKTNVLEAVSLLSPGRGLRRASLAEMARADGPGNFAVAARLLQHTLEPACSSRAKSMGAGTQSERTPFDFAQDERSPGAASCRAEDKQHIDIGTGTLAAAPERRQVRINGAAASATSLSEWLSVLWLTPAMDRLFSEGASGRRAFLDRLVLALDAAHATHSARYEAAMRARNKLLAEPETADPAWLGALEAGMAEHGARIAVSRERTLAQLGARLEAQPEGPFARAGLSLERWRPSAEDAEGGLRAALRAGRGSDAGAGRALVGPHRTDLIVTHLGKRQPADRCSTGEQKALLLSIVLAHADLVAERVGRRPVLLLDEVAAHLDPIRRAALFERLGAGEGQVWMTGTEASLFAGADGQASRFEVEGGRLRPVG